MATGFGIDAVKNGAGAIISGTSSQDIRQIWSGLYSPGLVSGGTVTTSPSALTYAVSAGVAVVKIADGQNVLMPIPAKAVITTTAPSSGTRTDIVYAQQRTPTTDGDSEVDVKVGTILPPRSVVLGRFIVSSSNSNTNAAIRTGSLDFSIPYGGSLGVLHRATSAYSGQLVENNNVDVFYLNGTINLPTDRRLQFAITTSSSSSDGSDGTIANWLEPIFAPQLDNIDQSLFVWRATGTWNVQTFVCETVNPVAAGEHTVRVRRNVYSKVQNRKLVMHPNPIYSTIFSVTDLGVAV